MCELERVLIKVAWLSLLFIVILLGSLNVILSLKHIVIALRCNTKKGHTLEQKDTLLRYSPCYLLIEYNSLILIYENPVFSMPVHGTGKNDTFNRAADSL